MAEAEQSTAAEETAAAAEKARRVLKENEWACVDPKCLHVNLNYKNTCERCGKPKPRSKNKVGHEIGKDAAEKSKGLFAAEDWACSKCGNINWARRQTCNICNAPKFGELEARTGYGGGYMDRQEIEYVDRQDSDDEFDEFGLKKKSKRKAIVEGEERSSPMAEVDEKMEGEEKVTDEIDNKYDLLAELPDKVEPKTSNDEPPIANDDDDESGSSANEEDLAKYDLTFDESPETLRNKIKQAIREEDTENASTSPANMANNDRHNARSPSPSGSSCCSLCSISNSPVRGRDKEIRRERDRDRDNFGRDNRRPRTPQRSRSPQRRRRYE